MEDLEGFIDQYFFQLAMENNNSSPERENNLAKRKRDSLTDTSDLTTDIQVSVLKSINKKLDVLSMLHDEIKELKVSLEFTHHQISDLQNCNTKLRSSLKTVTSEVDFLKKENKLLRERVLDIQSRSMRVNLIFSGIPENAPDNPEAEIKNFMMSPLKIPAETVNDLTFHRVHHLGPRRGNRPRPVVAKFEHFKQRSLLRAKEEILKARSLR